MSERVAAQRLPLRHPAEVPMFIFMVVLNFAILGVLIDFLASVALIGTELRGTNWEPTIRAVAGAILLVAPAILLVRQVQRASIRGTAVQLSRTQFPDLYGSMDDFAANLGVRPAPTIYLITATARSTRSPLKVGGPTTTSCCPTNCSQIFVTTTGKGRGSSSATRRRTSGSITWRCGTTWCSATRSSSRSWDRRCPGCGSTRATGTVLRSSRKASSAWSC